MIWRKRVWWFVPFVGYKTGLIVEENEDGFVVIKCDDGLIEKVLSSDVRYEPPTYRRIEE